VTTSLRERVRDYPKAKDLLEDLTIPSTTVARTLGSSYGIITSEAAVRRARNALPTPAYAQSAPPKQTVPKGWEPYAEEAGKIGSAIVHLPRPGATERDLLVGAGFDPDCWKIKGAVNTRRWMRYDQEWLYYYKFDVEQGESQQSIEVHVNELVKLIRKRVQTKYRPSSLRGTYVLVLSDWQIGKREGNKGTVDTVKRFYDCLEQTVSNIVALRTLGVEINNLAILSVGDLVEGCGDHYDMQTFSVDLDRRGQNRTVREMITQTLLTLAPLFAHTTVAVVGGNHGENRKEGKAYTTFADNDDVGCPEAVAEAFNLAGWTNISWVIPNDELSICVDFDGVKVGLTHGHNFKGGVNALKKAEDWWRANVFGLEPVNDAQILLSGHFHHYCAVNVTAGRTWIQAPTIDPGSKWYTDTSGITATPGVLTFVLDPENPFGYDHLRVLIPNDRDLTS
jgi:predicted phosphodiesterase